MSQRRFVQAMGSWHAFARERSIPHMVKPKMHFKPAPAVPWPKTRGVADAVQQAVRGVVLDTHAGGGVLHEYEYLPLGVGQVNALQLLPTQATSAVSLQPLISSFPAPASCACELTGQVGGANEQRRRRRGTSPNPPPLRALEPWQEAREKGEEEKERLQGGNRGRLPQAPAPHLASATYMHAGSGLNARVDLRQRSGAPQSKDKAYKGGQRLTFGAKQARNDQQEYEEQAAVMKALMSTAPVVAGAGLRDLSGLVQRQEALTRIAAKIKSLERAFDQAPSPSL